MGIEIPNVMIPGQRTEITSQQITRRDIEAYLAQLSEQRLSNDEFLNEMARHMRQLEEGGAHEDLLDQWKEQYEEFVNALTTDPVDITDYSAPDEDMGEPDDAGAGTGSGGDEGDINTNNLTPSDRQKIQEMADRYIGLPMEKAAKVEQAQKMLAYLKSQLPTDKAEQAFSVLAEKGIFHQPRYAGVPLVAGGVITLEVVGGIAIAPEVFIRCAYRWRSLRNI